MGIARAKASLLDPDLNWERLLDVLRAAAQSRGEGILGGEDGQHRTAARSSFSVGKSETAYDSYRQLNQRRLNTLQKSPAHTFT